MHHRVMGPPAVSYPVRRTVHLGLVLLALWLPGIVLVVAASMSSDARLPADHFSLLLAAVALSTLGLRAFWRTQRERLLRWDGGRWALDGPDTMPSPINLRRVEVRLDLQAFLLLRCVGSGAGAATWVWAERGGRTARWHLLRCALQHAPSAAPDGAQMESGLGAA